jgi:hypothetical protein
MAELAVREEEPLPAHKKAMLEACESGDISELQKLFQAHNVKLGDLPVYLESNGGPPSTWKMISLAVAQKHHSTVAYLLSTYPIIDLWNEAIIQAILDNPSIKTFKLLHSHSPRIIDFEFDPMRTILTEACRGGAPSWDFPASSETLPLIHYLLDNGADPNIGSFVGGGALLVALRFSRPLEIIKKIVRRGGFIGGLVISEAMHRNRLDALEFFFERDKLDSQLTDQKFFEKAHETGKKEIIALVEGYVSKRQRQQKKGIKGMGTVGEKMVSQKKRWWQFWKPKSETKW